MHLLGRNIYVAVNDFNGYRLVHIRRYDEHNERPGVLIPTKTGICLMEGEFENLKSFISLVDEDMTRLREKRPNPTKKRKCTPTSTKPATIPLVHPSQGLKDNGTDEMRDWINKNQDIWNAETMQTK